MRNVVPIIKSSDLKKFVQICYYAYPGFNTTIEKLLENFQRVSSEDKNSMYYVLKDNDKIMGGMRIIDYKMNYRNQFIDACGVGMVAVDLIHKKQKAAKDMIEFYLKHCQEQKHPIAILYPFRPDFYYKMGFGYGTPSLTYSFKPYDLYIGENREKWCYLGSEDLPLIADCYRRMAEQQHGYCLRSAYELESFKRRFNKEGVLLGYKVNRRLEGYIYFSSKKGSATNFLKNYIRVNEIIYTNPEALQALCHFLSVQADQYDRVELETQQPDFHYVLKDIRHVSQDVSPRIAHKCFAGGLGMMYRIVDVGHWFKLLADKYKFNCADVNIGLTVTDSFMPENNKTFYLAVKDQKLKVVDKKANSLMLSINISELSSLMMGCVRLESLHKVGKVTCQESDLAALSAFFNIPDVPQCLTAF